MRNNPRRGAILVVVAIMLVALLSFLAFVFDLSRMYAQKNELQTSADAASLAGVVQLLSNPDSVVDSAKSIGERNEVLKQAITVIRTDIDCGTWDDATAVYTPLSTPGGPCASTDNAVRVVTRDSANYVFPVLLNAGAKQLTTTAIAWQAYVDRASCVKPIAMRYETLTTTLQPTNLDTFRILTPYDMELLGTLPQASLTFTLLTSNPGEPGNFGAITLPGGSGGDWFKTNFATCYAGLIGRGDVINLETGQIAGPVAGGAGGWGSNAGFCDPLTSTGDCMDGSGNIGKLMVTALWTCELPNCDPSTTPQVQGKSIPITIMGLVSFMLDKVTSPPKTTVTGHFVAAPVGGSVSSIPSTVRRIVLVK
jgi:Putative Flp pilus-assembly TadE/G-like